ncbi:MAG: hypothetical protein ACFFEY_05755 [Candidatus Thorarchaeota archaeon]
MNNENEIINEDRFQINKIVKIKRLKIGMIIAIIAGTLFITSQSLIVINYHWYSATYQKLMIDYQNGEIDYDEYDDLRDQLQLNMYINLWSISILSTATRIGVYIVFIFIIIFMLSIVLDQAFSRKMRRLALGLSGVFILFILYPVIFMTGPIYYIP